MHGIKAGYIWLDSCWITFVTSSKHTKAEISTKQGISVLHGCSSFVSYNPKKHTGVVLWFNQHVNVPFVIDHRFQIHDSISESLKNTVTALLVTYESKVCVHNQQCHTQILLGRKSNITTIRQNHQLTQQLAETSKTLTPGKMAFK